MAYNTVCNKYSVHIFACNIRLSSTSSKIQAVNKLVYMEFALT